MKILLHEILIKKPQNPTQNLYNIGTTYLVLPGFDGVIICTNLAVSRVPWATTCALVEAECRPCVFASGWRDTGYWLTGRGRPTLSQLKIRPLFTGQGGRACGRLGSPVIWLALHCCAGWKLSNSWSTITVCLFIIKTKQVFTTWIFFIFGVPYRY